MTYTIKRVISSLLFRDMLGNILLTCVIAAIAMLCLTAIVALGRIIAELLGFAPTLLV
jgi:hypothetical protein